VRGRRTGLKLSPVAILIVVQDSIAAESAIIAASISVDGVSVVARFSGLDRSVAAVGTVCPARTMPGWRNDLKLSPVASLIVVQDSVTAGGAIIAAGVCIDSVAVVARLPGLDRSVAAIGAVCAAEPVRGRSTGLKLGAVAILNNVPDSVTAGGAIIAAGISVDGVAVVARLGTLRGSVAAVGAVCAAEPVRGWSTGFKLSSVAVLPRRVGRGREDSIAASTGYILATACCIAVSTAYLDKIGG
jgi:hypothetical protein